MRDVQRTASKLTALVNDMDFTHRDIANVAYYALAQSSNPMRRRLITLAEYIIAENNSLEFDDGTQEVLF